MKWNILIATTFDRRPMFDLLMDEFGRQIQENDLIGKVEVIFDEDDKEKSIGKKRQDLLEQATGDYINYFDSDDWPYSNYVEDIYKALLTGCDCLGMKINMTTNGANLQTCCHSLRYKDWENKKDGYDYVRNVTHFNCVKRVLALQAGFPDLRFGEDIIYSNKVTQLCKTEAFIDKPLFHYRYSNTQTHNQKYGIK